MTPRIGSLFAGYGGLDLAVEEVFDGELAWYSEIDRGALKILEHRFPGIANVGSVTEADWSQVEPVDILTGGSPCQDLSHAGRRAGMTEGTRSNLWVAMREAIAELRPKYVIWENVRGAYSAAADSAVEPCPGCVGDGSGVHLRALGRVLGDLSDLGYDAQWHGLRAAGVGAAHGRFRVFVAAYPKGDTWWLEHGDGGAAADAGDRAGHWEWARSQSRQGGEAASHARGEVGLERPGLRADDAAWNRWRQSARDDRAALFPTPTSRDGKGHNQRGDASCLTGALIPTPRATDGTKGGPNQRGSSGDLMLSSAVTLLPTPTSTDAKASGGNPHTTGTHGTTLTDATVRGVGGMLLPTPSVADVEGGRKARSGARSGELLLNGIAHEERWGDYAAAIARWESVIGRPAPEPTQTSTKGNPQLSAAFVEWLMGLPAGWVTDVPGITRNEALKALGNGVVPQQAAEALRVMLSRAASLERAS